MCAIEIDPSSAPFSKRPVPNQTNIALLVAAAMSATASILHLGCIVGGAPWYRFFGAGERMARSAQAGSWVPAFVTLGIAVVLAVWAAYALAGAGVIQRPPLLKVGLCAITAVYLLRGAVIVPALLLPRGPATSFAIWSSAICLAIGVVHAIGLSQVWSTL
jgi:hypothetical protein